jgi:hypothetical protein
MIPDDRKRPTIYTSALGMMEERMKQALPPYLTMSSQNRKITCRLTVSFMNVTAILTSSPSAVVELGSPETETKYLPLL